MQYLEPPLPLNEVNVVARQLHRKDYAYKCSDAPINAHCNKELCRTRRYGIGAAVQGANIANLRKYNSTPPVWFIDVNGEPLELDTENLDEKEIQDLQGKVMTHPLRIRSGGSCPQSPFKADITLAYTNDSGIENLDREYGGKPLFINTELINEIITNAKIEEEETFFTLC